MQTLDGKSVIVTGGAHGIGRAICEKQAQAGGAVFIVDIDTKAGEAVAAGIRAAGGCARFIEADVSTKEHAEAAAKIAAELTGRIGILCNYAAHLGKWHNAGESTEDEWDMCLRISLMGTQYFTQAVLLRMVRQSEGSIINISSVQGLVAGCDSVA